MVRVEVELPPDTTLEQAVDQEIREFEQFFMNELKNSRLTRSEWAILKSWFYFRAKQKGSAPSVTP